MIVCGMPPIRGQAPSIPDRASQRFIHFFTTHSKELLGAMQRHKVAVVVITAVVALVAVFAYRFFTRREEKPASPAASGELRYEIFPGKFFVSRVGRLGDTSQFQRIRPERIAVITSEIDKQGSEEELYTKHLLRCVQKRALAVQLSLLYGEESKRALFAAAKKVLEMTALIEIQLVDEEMLHSFDGVE